MRSNFIPVPGTNDWYNIVSVKYKYDDTICPPFTCYIKSKSEESNYIAVE